jgi:hypothetical protein
MFNPTQLLLLKIAERCVVARPSYISRCVSFSKIIPFFAPFNTFPSPLVIYTVAILAYAMLRVSKK